MGAVGGMTNTLLCILRAPENLHKGWCTMMGMRTNIEIDPEVMKEAQRLTGTRTMRETVDLALRELVARNKRLGILKLAGRVHWEGDLNEMRRGREWS